MRWTTKARLQGLCAAAPGGARLYRGLQARWGSLTPDPFRRLPAHVHMLRGLKAIGIDPSVARCAEVGTGHLPIVPIGFFLAGAVEVTTVDLHRRLDLPLCSRMLAGLAAERDRVVELYRGLVDPEALEDRLDVVGRLADRPLELFDRIGLRYVAPGDAASLPHDDGGVDIHFSMTVLEHVDRSALGSLLREARRVLSPDGVAVHFIDPSDHFAHQDTSIPRINFLKFSEQEWQRLAGNEFSYANRMRASQLERAFADAGLRVDRTTRTVDERSLAAVRAGFPVDDAFRHLDDEDLCTTTLRVYARRA